MVAMTKWADLPQELLGLILDRLVLFFDYIRFGIVCKSWLDMARSKEQERRRNCYSEPPLLLYSTGTNNKDHRYCLYNMWERKLYSLRLQIPDGGNLCGSSHGWLAFENKYLSLFSPITLLDPFSRNTINLPPIMKMPNCEDFNNSLYTIHKFILSADPCLHVEDWVAVVTLHGYPGEVAYIKSGERSWTFLSGIRNPVYDGCFYQGQLYALDTENNVVFVNFSHIKEKWKDDYGRDVTDAAFSVQTPFALNENYFLESYLLEWQGKLLLVGLCDSSYSSFEVFKLNHKKPPLSDPENSLELVKIHNLGNFSLFLSVHESISISASNFPNVQPNCIYFVDRFHVKCRLGIFDLEARKITQRYKVNATSWISPKLGHTLLIPSSASVPSSKKRKDR